jgi:ankyrin repeat protein
MRNEANGLIKGRTPLMLAAFRGDISTVRELLLAGADVDARDKDGDTALMFAAYRGHAEIVSLLLDYGANIYARARNGWTAKKAAESGHKPHILEMIKSVETGATSYVQ